MERLGCHSVFSYVFLDVPFFFVTFFPLQGGIFLGSFLGHGHHPLAPLTLRTNPPHTAT